MKLLLGYTILGIIALTLYIKYFKKDNYLLNDNNKVNMNLISNQFPVVNNNGSVAFDGADLNKISITHKESSFYLYSQSIVENNTLNYLNSIKKYDLNGKIFFAVKSNMNPNLIKIIADFGVGTDNTSLGEIKQSIKAGVEPKNMIFSGVGKDLNELQFAIENGVRINAESLNEIIKIDAMSKQLNKVTSISVRINPNIDGHTHQKISTGKVGDKFGILLSDLSKVLDFIQSSNNVIIDGIAFHIGSQIVDISAFECLFKEILHIYNDLTKSGLEIKFIDVGGGIGVQYRPNDKVIDVDEYMQKLSRILASKVPKDVVFMFEPGRYIVANSGVLVGKVNYIKESGGEKFAILNIGMNNLIRPALYDAYHYILPTQIRDKAETYHIAGPICESSDFFAKDRQMTELQEGDLVAILSVGAYGQSMASFYNARDLLPEFLIQKDGSVKQISERVRFGE